jgi:hypothetical protein
LTTCITCKTENSSSDAFCHTCKRNLNPDSPYFLKFTDFAHPQDLDNIGLLQGVEPITSMATSAVEFFQKSFSRQKFFKNAVQVNIEKYPQLYNLTVECGEKLCIQILPQLYILPSQSPNAYAMGGKKEPIIIVTTALVQMLSTAELAGVLGHEMGHIKGDHQQLHTMAYLLANGITFFSRLSLLSFPLQLGLKSWLRYAELTADRASLLITPNLEQIKKVQKKISNDKTTLHESVSSEWSEFTELWRTHPFTKNRIKELDDFYHSPEYSKIMLKMTLAKVMRCPYCNSRIGSDAIFCRTCRRALQ